MNDEQRARALRLAECLELRMDLDAVWTDAAALLRELAAEVRVPMDNHVLDDIWIRRDCIDAIQTGDILGQFRAAARAVERRHGITGDAK